MLIVTDPSLSAIHNDKFKRKISNKIVTDPSLSAIHNTQPRVGVRLEL